MHGRKSTSRHPHQSRRSFLQTSLGRRRRARASRGIRGTRLRGGPSADRHLAGRRSTGDSVFIGIAVPRTGTYAVQGEDELKGWQLAVEHINSGHPLIRQISPKTKKGVLGKEVKYGVADSAAKPNDAVQAEQRFITENKAILMTGSTSSAVAVALNKLAQREKVLYVTGISGSNDTTGKDCVRYGFRQCFYGQTAAAAIGPIIVKAYGKNKKAAYLTPDYTYGHTVTKSMQDYLQRRQAGRPSTNQVAPLGAPDYSSYLLNVANSGADVLINVNWGHDAVLSTQQAQQFGIFDKMKLVVPVPDSVPGARGRRRPAGRRLCRDRTSGGRSQDKYPLAKMFVEAFEKKYGYKPEWGANNAYMSFALWAEAVENAGTFYPPDVIKSFEAGPQDPVDRRRGLLPQGRPPARAARWSSSRARSRPT